MKPRRFELAIEGIEYYDAEHTARVEAERLYEELRQHNCTLEDRTTEAKRERDELRSVVEYMKRERTELRGMLEVISDQIDRYGEYLSGEGDA